MAKSAKAKIDEVVDAVIHVLEALRDQPRNTWMVSARANEAIEMLKAVDEEQPNGGTEDSE